MRFVALLLALWSAGDRQGLPDELVFNFGASSTLAMQIRAGAPVDVFFSADEAKMDGLATLERVTLLTNTLVVASNRPIAAPRDLLKLNRIAIAQPDSVPAGIYARTWLQRVGLWRELQPKLIPTADVRSALAAVDGDNVDAAFVYRTDAMTAKRTRIAYAVQGPDAPVIAYPVAVLRDARHADAARRFVKYLQSDAAMAVFKRYGFAPAPRPASAKSGGTISTRPARSRS